MIAHTRHQEVWVVPSIRATVCTKLSEDPSYLSERLPRVVVIWPNAPAITLCRTPRVHGPRQWKFSHIGLPVAFIADEKAVVIVCMYKRALSGMRHQSSLT